METVIYGNATPVFQYQQNNIGYTWKNIQVYKGVMSQKFQNIDTVKKDNQWLFQRLDN